MPHDGSPVVCRIGIHTGPCVSGVVGSKLPKFAVFGASDSSVRWQQQLINRPEHSP